MITYDTGLYLHPLLQRVAVADVVDIEVADEVCCVAEVLRDLLHVECLEEGEGFDLVLFGL